MLHPQTWRERGLLSGLGLATYWGKYKIELKILKQLRLKRANVYELKWKKLRDVNVHYSTVLRALKRLEQKKLVRIVSLNKVGRRRKIYACTLLGELIVATAEVGLKAGAQIIAESSKSFRECIGVHLGLDPDYPFYLTEEIIWEIARSKRGEMVIRPDLDFYVRNIERRWVRKNIIEELSNLSSRPRILRYLKKITHIDWIRHYVKQGTMQYAKRENEWLQTLEDFGREAKLSRFFEADKEA